MILAIKRTIVFVVAASIAAHGMPRRAVADRSPARRASTSAQAAEWRASEPSPSAGIDTLAAGGTRILAMGALAGYADPDTSEFEFPEEENKHLARDITVWVIASAFVAYFIIKVFIEEDDEEEPDNRPPGKTIP